MPTRSGDTIYDQRGTPLTLGRLLKSGGAGSVFLLKERPQEVAKLYHSSKDAPVYERKLRAMLELQPELPAVEENGQRLVQIAWPVSLLRDRARQFIGFTMPILDVSATSDLEHVLQERQARAEGLPTGLGAKMTLAANLAAMLATLHRRQHYVVDLKPLNVRFYRDALYIAMLDCDGFSIQGKGERFPAGQVTPDYLAAEFQQRGVSAGAEEAQDRFALAVMVFQLLNSGLHPYAGRPKGAALPSDLPGRIAANLYPYGRKAHAQMLPSPVSGHEAFPAALREMFDRAFSTQARRRPSAQEWATLLLDYARRSAGHLVECSQDAAHQHFAGMPCAACARAGLLAGTARAAKAQSRRKAGSGGKRRQPARRPAGNAPAAQGATAAARVPAGQAGQAATASTLPGIGTRATMAVIGTLLLGWVMGWGMPAFRRYADLAVPSMSDGLPLGMHLVMLGVAILVFVLFVPVLILSRRP
ncbi:hypothetical protein [Stenotrophomonas sp. Marseille-Q5258]|uniref:hypothetical protein n=1 Tax=Stenotrophomonas sp. Marseille-Q5258 TaxID=2972779 RepID=UPI0021C67D56|nr:hypothetical protein [Stenotrophomonas sp. Marseille-Q5258]